MTAYDLASLSTAVDESFFLVGLLVLGYELVKNISARRITRHTLLDMLASVTTQLPYTLVEVFLLGAAYVGFAYVSDTYITWVLPINVWTIIGALLACDFLYYWEHRLAHEIRLLWTQHAVHHSSRHMNIFVAIRFGPFEGAISTIIHFPLVLLGFPPELVLFGIITVLAYQVWIHTESISRLGVLDKIFNTPSNHRVHHGCDEKYLDRNYGGVLIIWDRLFGTYQPEEETPRYGLKRDFNSVNPLVVWFSELPGLVRDLVNAGSMRETFMILFAHPNWAAERSSEQSRIPARVPAKPAAPPESGVGSGGKVLAPLRNPGDAR